MTHHKKHRKGRHHKGGGSSKKLVMAMAIGGGILGYIDKHVTTLPTIPMLGKAGTIAVIAYLVGDKFKVPMARDVALAAAAVAGYEYASAGKIAGDVSGVAAQF